jgi:alginate O-acetyltransferase complex protein AlgI
MLQDFLLLTLAPAAFGLLFTRSGILIADSKWPGKLAFLLAQLVQIYAFGFAPIAGIAVVTCILGGLAILIAFPTISARARFVGPIISFGAYILYWLFEKYIIPLAIMPHLAEGGIFSAAHDAASIIAMVGISFIGFKLIHFFVDFMEGEIASFDALEFLSWLLFFPSITAGPMQRFQEWQEQIGRLEITAERAIWGGRRIIFGAVLKVVLADNIHSLTLPQMSEGALSIAPWAALAAGALIYSLYLYFDFSGYCHIAIGTAVFWGISLPENFNNPYLARNLAEFWNRWHITLSHILRDYLFYPMSLTMSRMPRLRRHPVVRASVPPVVTFLLAGLWHGATIGYIIFGLIHGIGLAYLAVRRSRAPASAWSRWWATSRVGYVGAAALNYVYVTVSFVFFSLTNEKLRIIAERAIGHF